MTLTESYWNGNGKYQEQHQQLFDQLVPALGNCETLGGEILRASARVYYDCYNNGWINNTSGAWHFLDTYLQPAMPTAKERETIREALNEIRDKVNTGGYSDYGQMTEIALETIANAAVEFNLNNPAAKNVGEWDMFSFQNPDEYAWDDEEDEYAWGDDE